MVLIFIASLSYSKSYKTIIVKQGQSIQEIAKIHLKNRNSWRNLLRYNGLQRPQQIKPGMKLRIPYSLASERIATLIFKKGTVTINGKNASIGSILKVGYRVATGSNGKAVIKLDDGSKVKLESNSLIVLSKYGIKKRSRRSIIQLKKGGMLVRVNKLTRRNSFGVSTVTATAGVRGTTFHAKLDKNNRNVKITVYSGKVKLKQKGKGKKSVTIFKGELINLQKGKEIDEDQKSAIPKSPKWIKQ